MGGILYPRAMFGSYAGSHHGMRLPRLSFAVLLLQLGLVSSSALADPAFDSVARGAIFDTGIGTSWAGDTLMAELGGQSAGIRSRRGVWLLQWDVLLAAKAGYLANAEPYLFLLGGHALAWAEAGARFLPTRSWSPYGGLRVGNEAQILGHPGADLERVNAVDGVGGINDRALVRIDAGASFLDRSQSLLLVGFAQETFRAPTINTSGQAFFELGLGVRYDLSRSLMASLEGIWGTTPSRSLPPGLTDRTTHAGVSATFRKIFKNGMWIAASVLCERDTDHIVYPETGAMFDTANPPTFGFTLLYGLRSGGPGHEEGSLAAFLVLLPIAASCDPQKAGWGFEAIDSMKTPADDPALACGASVPGGHDGGAARVVRLRRPALARPTRSASTRSVLASIPIGHVIVVMKENRSFDHLLGQAPRSRSARRRGRSARRTRTRTRTATRSFRRTRRRPASRSIRATSRRRSSRASNGGKMDGFVQNAAATTVVGRHVRHELLRRHRPAVLLLARDDVRDQRSPLRADGERHVRQPQTSSCSARTPASSTRASCYPPPSTPSIFQLADDAPASPGAPTATAPSLSDTLDWSHGDPGVHPMQSFYDELDTGTLPNVAFVDGIEYVEDDHPSADLQRGEAWMKGIYDHAVDEPTVGAARHRVDLRRGGRLRRSRPAARGVPRRSRRRRRSRRWGRACRSSSSRRGRSATTSRTWSDDHTAITRFIEALFDLPALTARDANSDALLDCSTSRAGAISRCRRHPGPEPAAARSPFWDYVTRPGSLAAPASSSARSAR